MKKNISINISGIIFHIEEDGFDTLKKYLDSINKYFSTFEDSSEILIDIESRIAEIFLSKLNEEKQVITVDDVNSLVATMGSVSDFKAAEAADTPEAETASSSFASDSAGEAQTENTSTADAPPIPPYTPPKRLLRDQKRKILGGVCAGLASYFSIDAIWVRFSVALLSFFAFLTMFVFGLIPILMAYIIMWIVVPGSYDLEEPVTGKKMFRDPERKIIGGVSGGVAAFLALDTILVRVLFILFIPAGGLGLVAYIVLWIILPEAKTVTDRVQMQGEPITLSNIESTIKKSQTEKPAEEESTLVKILLFPFRLIGMILRAIGRILVPILEVIRVSIGIIIVLIGLCLVFAFIVTAGLFFGLFSATALEIPWAVQMSEGTIPVDTLMAAFPVWTMVAAVVGTITPSIFIILLGASIVAKRIVFSATTAWTLFILFFISMAILAVGIPEIIYSFKEQGEYRTENVYKVTGKRAVLRINEVGMDDYDVTRLTLRGYEGTDLKLTQIFKAQGSTRARAIANAKMVDYTVNVQDSVFTFDSNFKFREDATFRAQRLDLILYIPYNYPFTMDEGISRFITDYVDCCGMAGTNTIDQYTWKITEDTGLECLDCPNVIEQKEKEEEGVYTLRDFDELELSGKFDVRINRGDDYAVELVGPKEQKDKYKITRIGETLIIEYETSHLNWRSRTPGVDDMRINITMPSLEKIEATGFGSIRFDGFSDNEYEQSMEIALRGPIRIRGDLKTQNLSLNLTGKSEAELSGKANNLDARIELASRLRAYSLEVDDAMVEVSGASSAKVNVSSRLEVEEGVASSVDYRGNPTVIKRD